MTYFWTGFEAWIFLQFLPHWKQVNDLKSDFLYG